MNRRPLGPEPSALAPALLSVLLRNLGAPTLSFGRLPCSHTRSMLASVALPHFAYLPPIFRKIHLLHLGAPTLSFGRLPCSHTRSMLASVALPHFAYIFPTCKTQIRYDSIILLSLCPFTKQMFSKCCVCRILQKENKLM